VEGKDVLMSRCNSCGTKNTHDSKTKAGKVLVLHLKAGKGVIEDITNKDTKKD